MVMKAPSADIEPTRAERREKRQRTRRDKAARRQLKRLGYDDGAKALKPGQRVPTREELNEQAYEITDEFQRLVDEAVMFNIDLVARSSQPDVASLAISVQGFFLVEQGSMLVDMDTDAALDLASSIRRLDDFSGMLTRVRVAVALGRMHRQPIDYARFEKLEQDVERLLRLQHHFLATQQRVREAERAQAHP